MTVSNGHEVRKMQCATVKKVGCVQIIFMVFGCVAVVLEVICGWATDGSKWALSDCDKRWSHEGFSISDRAFNGCVCMIKNVRCVGAALVLVHGCEVGTRTGAEIKQAGRHREDMETRRKSPGNKTTQTRGAAARRRWWRAILLLPSETNRRFEFPNGFALDTNFVQGCPDG